MLTESSDPATPFPRILHNRFSSIDADARRPHPLSCGAGRERERVRVPWVRRQVAIPLACSFDFNGPRRLERSLESQANLL